MEAAAEEIRAKGATLLAICMQDPADSRKSQRDNKFSYPILTDTAGELAEKFGIRWTLQDYVIDFYRMFDIILPTIHSDDEWNLPMPARHVIDTDGAIAYAEVNPDYTHRPEPSELFPVLDKLQENANA